MENPDLECQAASGVYHMATAQKRSNTECKGRQTYVLKYISDVVQGVVSQRLIVKHMETR